MKPLLLAAVTIIAVMAAFAQRAEQVASPSAGILDSQPPPECEVASVKPTDPGRIGSTFNFAPGELQIGGGTPRRILEMAYDLRTFQILGGPGWLDAERYDISAKNDSALKDLAACKRFWLIASG